MKKQMKKQKISFSDVTESLKLCFRFNKYVLRYWKFILTTLIFGNSCIILGLIKPYIAKNVLDKGILAKNARVFIIYILVGIGIYIMNLVIMNINTYLKTYVTRKIRIDLTKDVLKRIRRYSLRFFQQRSTGGHIFRISGDITTASDIINATLPHIITTIFKLVAITIVIIIINWKILFLIAIYQFIVLFQIKLFIKKLEELKKKGLEKSENIFKTLNELFSHIYIVKVFGTMVREIRMYFHGLIERMRLEIKGTKLNIASGLLSNMSDKLFFGIIGFYGALLVIRGQMTLGSLGAIMMYITQGVGAYAALLNLGQQMVLNRISLERLTALSDAEVEVKEKDDAASVIFRKGKVEFRDITFGYIKDKYVLNNMDFHILPNSHVAIVGSSGQGKTTILNLILRLYDVEKGAIILDGYDLRDIRFKSIYSQISIAPQEPFLWNDSIKNNVNYGRKGASFEEIQRAARIAQIYDFIEQLPDGFDTLVGEEACWISQGQKQRIAIARAVIKHPKILMIDEAMSSLDSETEDRIVDNIKSEFRGSTVIVVSHRLSTVKKMDLVYFLQDERTMESGTHEELLKKSLEYRELFASQIEETSESVRV